MRAAVSRDDELIMQGSRYLYLAYEYAENVRSGAILSCRYVQLAVERWFSDFEHQDELGIYFDESAAAFEFGFTVEYCRHYQGELAGKTIELSPWQCFINANIFGWMRVEDHTRRFRTVYEEIARKNGKTTKLASVGAFLATRDGEPGAKVYSAATKRDQAKEIFESIEKMVRKDPVLNHNLRVYRSCITYPATDSRIELLSSDYNTQDGFNVHGALVDELHAHKDSGVWDVLESGRGARRQPLIWGITTAGKNQNSFCYEMRSYAIKILDGTVRNDAFFAIIYTLDKDDDWTDPSVWIKANPNLNISVSLRDLKEQCEKAKEMPSAGIEFKTKRLNIWVNGDSTWMNMERWNDCQSDNLNDLVCWAEGKKSELDGLTAYGGIDLSSVEDLSAFSLCIKLPEGKTGFISRAYLPEYAFDKRIRSGGYIKTLYQEFRNKGFLIVTPGEVVDYNFIKRDVFHACERFNVVEIAFDRWNSSKLVTELTDEEVPMVAMGQGTASINAPMKELMRMVLAREVVHNNPLLTFAVSNVVSVENEAGDIKFAKNRVSEKIDPAVASIMALDRSMVLEDDTSEAIDDFLMNPIKL